MTLKIWGGPAFVDGTQVRCLVIAPTKKKGVELLNTNGLNISGYRFDGWWSETRNDEELALMDSGSGVWVYITTLGTSKPRRIC